MVCPCLNRDGNSYPLLHHLIDVLPPDSTANLPPVHELTETRGYDGHAVLNKGGVKLFMVRQLVSRWGADVRLLNLGDLMPVMALHAASLRGNLLSVKFFIKECGLSMDELTPKERFTTLMFSLRGFIKKENEEELVPIVRYLLAKGVDINITTRLGFGPTGTVLEKGWHKVHKLLVSHARVKQAEGKKQSGQGKKQRRRRRPMHY